jgi:integrase/recombinase XerC
MNIEAFMQHLESSPDRSLETIKAYRSDLKLFNQYLTSRRLRVTQVNSAVVHDYMSKLEQQTSAGSRRPGLSRATRRRRLVSIRRYFEYLRSTTNPKLRDPTYGIRVGRLDNDECKAVEESTLSNLMHGIDVFRDKVLLSLFLASGLRLSELHQLDRNTIEVEQHIDRDGHEHVVGTGEVVGKRKKRRRFFIDAETVDELVDYLATRTDEHQALFLSERKQRLSKRSIQDILSRWCRKLQITPMHVHQLRHQYAVRLANAGIDTMVLKTLMGHDDLRTTNRYFKLYDQTVARQYHAAMAIAKPPQVL